MAKHIGDNMGGTLDLYKNMACLSLEEDDCYGVVHPKESMLSEVVLLLCTKIQEKVFEGSLKKQENECIHITKEQFSDMLLSCRKEHSSGWSKEYREMTEGLLIEHVFEYMKNWMMIRVYEDHIAVFPSVGRTAGSYPKDFNGGCEE